MMRLYRTTMTEPEQPDKAEHSFVAEKLGGLHAELAKVVATLNLLTPTQAGKLAGRNRTLLYIVIALLIILIVLLGMHAAYSAGWFGG